MPRADIDIDPDLFKGMPGLEDVEETATSGTDNPTEGQEPSTETVASPESGGATEAGTAEPTDQGTSTGTDAGNTGNSETPKVQGTLRHDGLVAVPDASNPKLQNLVDPKTGQVVVPHGAARRFYDNAQRARQQHAELLQQQQALTRELDAYKAATTAGSQLGLNVQEQSTAMQLMADFKKSPVKTLETIVAQLQAEGVQLPFLSDGSIVPATISAMIDQRLAPLVNAQQATATAQTQASEAQKTLDTFLATHQNARVHANEMADLMDGNPSLTLLDAYTQLMEYALEHGYDFKQPLRPQVQARHLTGSNPSNTRPAPAETPTRPMPNRSANGQAVSPREAVVEFNGGDDWDQILSQSLREAGIIN